MGDTKEPIKWNQSLTTTLEGVKKHAEDYPYVWASYGFVFVTLGLYSTYTWRGMRQAENKVLRLQEEVKKRMAGKEELLRVQEKTPSQ